MSTFERVGQWKLGHPVLAGLCNAFIWLGLGALALSVLLVASSSSEEGSAAYVYLIHGFALLVGGWSAGRRSGRKGWYYGGLTGLLYMLLVLMIGFLAMDAGLSWNKALYILLSFAAGGIGGMIGVNMKKNN